jgi:hypothetical protein
MNGVVHFEIHATDLNRKNIFMKMFLAGPSYWNLISRIDYYSADVRPPSTAMFVPFT